MKRKFAVFDIDGTLFRSHMFYEVLLSQARSKKLHPSINEKAITLYEEWKKRSTPRSFDLFDKTIIQAFDAVITELSPEEYDMALENILPNLLDHTYVYTKALLTELKDKGYFILAISGARMEEVNIFAKYHGFDDWVGQLYERTPDGKRYTGVMTKTWNDKHLTLEKFVEKHDLDYEGSYAIGDTAGDISMLKAVDHPIAFNPTQELLEHAMSKDWKIVIERKSIAYELAKKGEDYVLAKTDA